MRFSLCNYVERRSRNVFIARENSKRRTEKDSKSQLQWLVRIMDHFIFLIFVRYFEVNLTNSEVDLIGFVIENYKNTQQLEVHTFIALWILQKFSHEGATVGNCNDQVDKEFGRADKLDNIGIRVSSLFIPSWIKLEHL